MITQICILIFSALAVFLVSKKEGSNVKKWGFVLGMFAQPFWFYETYINEQWGMFVLTFWYTYAWGMGIYNYFVYPKKVRTKTQKQKIKI